MRPGTTLGLPQPTLLVQQANKNEFQQPLKFFLIKTHCITFPYTIYESLFGTQFYYNSDSLYDLLLHVG